MRAAEALAVLVGILCVATRGEWRSYGGIATAAQCMWMYCTALSASGACFAYLKAAAASGTVRTAAEHEHAQLGHLGRGLCMPRAQRQRALQTRQRQLGLHMHTCTFVAIFPTPQPHRFQSLDKLPRGIAESLLAAQCEGWCCT